MRLVYTPYFFGSRARGRCKAASAFLEGSVNSYPLYGSDQQLALKRSGPRIHHAVKVQLTAASEGQVLGQICECFRIRRIFQRRHEKVVLLVPCPRTEQGHAPEGILLQNRVDGPQAFEVVLT